MNKAAALLLCLLSAPLSLAARTDNIDLPFRGDPEVLGRWRSVAYVDSAEEFSPDAVQPAEELFFKGLEFLPGGATESGNEIWTRGFVISPADRTASKYELKRLGGEEYLFMEWKSGDYILRGTAPGYYVLVREKDYARLGPEDARPERAAPKSYNCMNATLGRGICRRPEPAVFSREPFKELPVYKPGSEKSWQVDLRGMDLRKLDLSGRTADLLRADFDTRTKFPKALPPGYVPEEILELGKNPGLGVRALHQRGLTGKGVAIAIIDQPLLTGHKEYSGALKSYEELHLFEKAPAAAMHGAAVASIAVGKTCGVAPGASLHYLATDFTDGARGIDFRFLASAVDRVVAISEALPKGKGIRALSISRGFRPGDRGAAALLESIAKARKAGMLVVTTSPEAYYDFRFNGLGRGPLSDPDSRDSYRPGLFWERTFYPGGRNESGRLLLPMDSRTTASPAGSEDYVFYTEGGMSWAAPYLAGLYALALEADPALSPEAFLRRALATAGAARFSRDGVDFSLEGIVDPASLLTVQE
ncbi:MAG: S8/S53 family peptidase [Elusimicrobiales bacterium]|nr:S8/S53 family peptidase [Elusimicrobiales bacterium]